MSYISKHLFNPGISRMCLSLPISVFRTRFFNEVIQNKKNTHNDEWESDNQQDSKAHANRMVHIMQIIRGAQCKILSVIFI